MAYSVGGMPGQGRFCCTTCGWSTTLQKLSDKLPPCPECHAEATATYEKC